MDLLRQRVYAIALGYEDLNDHDTLRKDTALQTAVGRDSNLGSGSTLCRFENAVTPDALWQISICLVELFIESFEKPPNELILDFDATDDPIHGDQVGRFFTATMIATAFCRCTPFAANSFWPPICAPVGLTRPEAPGAY